MTEIKLRCDTLHIRLEADQHAGDKSICAAISATVSNLINVLEYEQEHRRVKDLRWDVQDGRCCIEATAFPKYTDRFGGITDFVRVSLEAFAENYKKHIKLDVYVGER